ncbi:hypothetical protein HMF8227_00867 [Saliniradius amylolyticus]|uniref:Uncharacterized protein n=2 Tax=Saliniradius amylolyticus TaxID=2183582 RepID=A0A2S2E1G2_9ALTE|nr:hypothetical protein HMF8227_00867 [Saliniradius amylolyticus]
MSFKQVQREFYQHIRDPEHSPRPEELEDRRMRIYRELFFNNVKGFLDTGFPVLKSLYSELNWQKLCRQFFVEHRCRSPYFVDISKEFVEYLDREYQPRPDDYPFLAELAHYEWVELALDSSTQTIAPEQLVTQLVPSSALSISPLAWLLSYDYPVHQVAPKYCPDSSDGPYYFVVHRDIEHCVHFTQLNPMNAVMLDFIDNHPGVSTEMVITQMTSHLPQLAPQQVYQGAMAALQELAHKQVLIGGESG